MTDLNNLIAKLEAATEGSRALDAEIALAINAVPTGAQLHKDGITWWLDNIGVFAPEDYTTSIDVALTLVPSGERWEVGFCGAAVESSGGPIRSVHAEPAIALSIAALKARAA